MVSIKLADKNTLSTYAACISRHTSSSNTKYKEDDIDIIVWCVVYAAAEQKRESGRNEEEEEVSRAVQVRQEAQSIH